MKLNRIGNKKIKNIIITMLTAMIMLINIVLISSVFGNDIPLKMIDKWLINNNKIESKETEYENMYESDSKQTSTNLMSSSNEGIEDIDLASNISRSLENNRNSVRMQNTDTETYIYDAQDFCAFRDSVNSGNNYDGKTVYLMENIDLSTVCSRDLGDFVPIATR